MKLRSRSKARVGRAGFQQQSAEGGVQGAEHKVLCSQKAGPAFWERNALCSSPLPPGARFGTVAKKAP
ncbi:hypothetical protein AYR62_01280 [Secundilactobacillus paracollinoides]|uniref:Uncharacterized protein n=1 Tax=Secundilactobacillus paracollinoides TaxID=240427 RepID=A0A1B2IV87_9LACO|nr:hypothetical protein AYR61_01650 [Secundilactobacillus paracollinoides]ANZ62867.1 hypothetical protein AYR62_01280 [Secundilactobacillus paracollinoides]ANZ65974.1 hypothetical protein AYR63_01670 [Secundilactobacillus paracollinoides]